MKKVFGIVLATVMVLTAVLASAVPVAAVEAPIEVCLSNPIAKANSTYCIAFHNVGLLKALDSDYIDIMFPTGTNLFWMTGVTVQKSAAPPNLTPSPCGPCICPVGWTAPTEGPPVFDISVSYQIASNTSLRVTLNGTDEIIDKCEFVLIEVGNVTNPSSCEHHLEVGTSTHTPVDSETYTIFCAKIDLVGGVNPATGLAMMNLISLPCYPIDTSIEAVLADLFLYAKITEGTSKPFSFSVWYYDTAEAKWYKYVSDTSFDDLKTIEAGKSYWIKPSSKITIWIHGYNYPPGQGPPVKWHYDRSWNMVGYACLVSRSASSYLFYTLLAPMYSSYCVIAIWGWNPTTQTYVNTGWIGDSPPTTDPMLIPGQGYWMAFVADCCNIIPPSDCDC